MTNDNQTSQSQRQQPLSAKQQLLFALVPVILFTVVEEWGGLTWALLLSIVYAVLEVSWEWLKHSRPSSMTLFSNSMVVGLSAVSYYTQSGFWFKLQPAILELLMAGILIGSYFLKKPMLVVLMKKQGHQVPHSLEVFFAGLTLRLGIFFVLQAGLAAFAGFYWSTEIWAFLKSVGVVVMMLIYMFVEMGLFRWRQKINQKGLLD